MTHGGPGFASDVIASTIYKQYQAGFYGLATAGNVILFIAVTHHRVSDDAVLQPPRDRAVRALRSLRSWWLDVVALLVVAIVFVVPFLFIVVTAAKERAESAKLEFTWPANWRLLDNLAEVIGARDNLMVTAMRNSLILTVASVTLIVFLSAMVGYVLQRRRDRRRHDRHGADARRPRDPARDRPDHLCAAGGGPVQDTSRPRARRGRVPDAVLGAHLPDVRVGHPARARRGRDHRRRLARRRYSCA